MILHASESISTTEELFCIRGLELNHALKCRRCRRRSGRWKVKAQALPQSGNAARRMIRRWLLIRSMTRQGGNRGQFKTQLDPFENGGIDLQKDDAHLLV